MNIKAIVTLSALMLALAPAIMTQVSAFPGENGQGHDQKTDCDHGPEGACRGNSGDADDHEECTTTFAGKSDNVKDVNCS